MMKTISLNINEATMGDEFSCTIFLTKDLIVEGYVVSIPSRLFSCYIKTSEDYEFIIESPLPFEDKSKRIFLVKAIKAGINKFESESFNVY